jgi:hypothetical protein
VGSFVDSLGAVGAASFTTESWPPHELQPLGELDPPQELQPPQLLHPDS